MVRRRRGRRLLRMRLLLLGRLFYRLLGRCFLRCHENSTPLQRQIVSRCMYGISEFDHRVHFVFEIFQARARDGCMSAHLYLFDMESGGVFRSRLANSSSVQ
jgi:hypothetical protein